MLLSCIKTIIKILKLYPRWIIVSMFIYPFASTFLNIYMNKLLLAESKDLFRCLITKICVDIMSYYIHSKVNYNETRRLCYYLRNRINYAEIYCGVPLPGFNQSQKKQLQYDEYKLNEFLYVIPMVWETLISFTIIIYNIESYIFRFVFICISCCLLALLIYLTDSSLYVKEKQPIDKIIDFNDTMKVKMQLSMGYKMIKDYNLIRMEKQDKQQKIQKFIMCLLDFMFAWYSISKNDIAQIHTFGGMSWMIGAIADNIKSFQYYEYINEYITFCETLEGFHMKEPLVKESIERFDKIKFINAGFGYYRDDLTKSPDYDQKIFNLNFTFNVGKFYYLEAPNGIGKSTILKMFKYNLYTGQVFFGSINRSNLSFDDINSKIFYITQASEYTPHFSKEQIETLRGKDEWLEQQLDISPLFGKDTVEMSGGQKKRLFIYLVLTSSSPVLLLDEILSELSAQYCSDINDSWLNRVINTLMEWPGKKNKLIVMVGHGLSHLIHSKEGVIKLHLNNEDRQTHLTVI